MKTSILFSSLLALTVITSVGCTKSQDHKKDLDNKLAEIQKQNAQRQEEINAYLENIMKNSTSGGHPGVITLDGVTVLDVDKLDTRITISQSVGLNRSGSATTTLDTKETVKLNSLTKEKIESLTADLKKREDQKTYINLGCALAESEIAGLTEIAPEAELSKDVATVSASRIFICGELKSSRLFYTLSASEIMLKDAALTVQKNLGNITLNSNTLVLVGKNKITGLGEDGSGLLLTAAGINLTVTTEIYGDGELALETKGANNIAEGKAESK